MAACTHLIVNLTQAGFIPGRSIFDHTMLAKLMIEYAEPTEENDAIALLDQEKVYDKVAHDYLWEPPTKVWHTRKNH